MYEIRLILFVEMIIIDWINIVRLLLLIGIKNLKRYQLSNFTLVEEMYFASKREGIF